MPRNEFMHWQLNGQLSIGNAVEANAAAFVGRDSAVINSVGVDASIGTPNNWESSWIDIGGEG